MKISSSYRTELAIAINELTGQALLDRLESIVQDASEVAYKQALDVNYKQALDVKKLLTSYSLPYGSGE
jgi:hypothetical protein